MSKYNFKKGDTVERTTRKCGHIQIGDICIVAKDMTDKEVSIYVEHNNRLVSGMNPKHFKLLSKKESEEEPNEN